MTTQCVPSAVFCSAGLLPKLRQRYPASVPVAEFIITEAPTAFSAPKMPARAKRSAAEQAVIDALLAGKPIAPSAKPDRSAVNFSPAALAFRNEFKLPGQGDVPQAKPTAKAKAPATPSPEKKPTRAGMKPQRRHSSTSFRYHSPNKELQSCNGQTSCQRRPTPG